MKISLRSKVFTASFVVVIRSKKGEKAENSGLKAFEETFLFQRTEPEEATDGR